jgi:hypothetical protein
VPRYAPLPIVSLDPRNEAELVQVASQRVYDASNQTLNDFSSGNPLAALIEGQAFAQGEFLYWANQLPESILAQWIGPFLGAQRRIGSPASAQLLVEVTPSDTSVTVVSGSVFTTDPNLTAGQAFSFITANDIVIPAGQITAVFPVYSQYVGVQYNVGANTIVTSPATGINFLSITNPLPAVGGSDAETWQEVQERFFTLIRSKNPVSGEDWANLFINLYGTGTLTSVQPNRPSIYPYNYLTDYLLPNGQVSFFVLGPEGVELTDDQLAQGQNVVNFSLPVETQGHLYPITLSQVQYDITLEVDANGSYGSNTKASSLEFRNLLFEILRPGNVFPSTTDPTVSDVDAAFYSAFDATQRYVNPHINASRAYNTPPGLGAESALWTQVYPFAPSNYLLNQNDLVYTTLPTPVYYPVVTGFTPTSSSKPNQTISNSVAPDGNLLLKQIKLLVPGVYNQGDVVYWDATAQLYVILQSVTIGSTLDIPALITTDNNNPKSISQAKTFSAWTVGNTYSDLINNLYNPEIVQYDYSANEFIPDPTSLVPLSQRPGAFVWIVNSTFTLAPSTNDLTGAATAGVIGNPVVPLELIPGTSYTAGTWVYTPQVGSGPDPVADPYFNYVDLTKGVVNKYAYVVTSFTYQPQVNETVSEYFDTLTQNGTVNEIVVENADQGLPIFKYKPRFNVGQYLEYKTDSASAPNYYIAATYFTPNSTDAQTLVNEGLIYPLATTDAQLLQLSAYLASGTGLTPVRMFNFFKGDRTFFRQGTQVISYTATTNVSPLFGFPVYLQNGVFVPSEQYVVDYFDTTNYIPYFNPEYINYAEDTIVAEDGRNLYRVMRAFTPPTTVVNWTGTSVLNTTRNEEYFGNLLRYVDEYICEEPILSQMGRDISAIKLGIAQITIIPRNTGRTQDSQQKLIYVWENTATLAEAPQLSYFSGTTYPYSPPDYGTGTLKL